MKRKLFLIFMVLIGQLAVVYANETVKAGKSIVGKQYLDVIEKSDSMTVIVIDPWSESVDNWMDGYGEILSKTTTDDKELIEKWFMLLLPSDNYIISDNVKNCTFMPDYAIVFHYKNEAVIVACSFYCDTIRFAKGDKYQDLDDDNIRLEFMQLLQKSLPKDRYLRYLMQKQKSNFR